MAVEHARSSSSWSRDRDVSANNKPIQECVFEESHPIWCAFQKHNKENAPHSEQRDRPNREQRWLCAKGMARMFRVWLLFRTRSSSGTSECRRHHFWTHNFPVLPLQVASVWPKSSRVGPSGPPTVGGSRGILAPCSWVGLTSPLLGPCWRSPSALAGGKLDMLSTDSCAMVAPTGTWWA